MIRLKQLFSQYRDIILYLFFGGVTTLINIIVFYVTTTWCHWSVTISYCVAFVISALFGSLSMRVAVFHSTTTTWRDQLIELCHFFGNRLLAAIGGYVILQFGVQILHQPAFWWNIIQSVVVIVANFIIGKWIVARQSPQTGQD